MPNPLIFCRICEHEYLPAAHRNHCPCCGTLKQTFMGNMMVFNGVTLRPIERVIHHTGKFIHGIITR